MNSFSGFTLIEILVVVIIIGTIASIVGINIIDRLKESRIETTKVQIANIESALKLFKISNGFYPDTDQDLDSLVTKPTVGREVKKSGFMDEVPVDGWGNNFQYIGPDQTGADSYEIISAGPDQQLQTEDDVSSKNNNE